MFTLISRQSYTKRMARNINETSETYSMDFNII